VTFPEGEGYTELAARPCAIMNLWGDEPFVFERILFLASGKDVQIIKARFLSGGNINTMAQVLMSEGVLL